MSPEPEDFEQGACSSEAYWQYIQDVAKEAFKAKDANRYIAEHVGNSWARYCPEAYAALQHSDYPDAIFSKGAHVSCSSLDELIRLAAYYSMLEDVYSCLILNRYVWQLESDRLTGGGLL